MHYFCKSARQWVPVHIATKVTIVSGYLVKGVIGVCGTFRPKVQRVAMLGKHFGRPAPEMPSHEATGYYAAIRPAFADQPPKILTGERAGFGLASLAVDIAKRHVTVFVGYDIFFAYHTAIEITG